MPPDSSLPDIKLLRLLDQFHTTRSVTRTAEALGQSQPTVSIWLARARHPRIGGGAGKAWNLDAYQAESHIGISSGTGHQLLDSAVAAQRIARRIQLELPGFLGLSAILQTTDLIATLPRHIGETLARATGLQVLACPLAIAGFTVKQYWHARYHHDSANRWLRSLFAELFVQNPPVG